MTKVASAFPVPLPDSRNHPPHKPEDCAAVASASLDRRRRITSMRMHNTPKPVKTSQFETSGMVSKSTLPTSENGGSPEGVPPARNESVSELVLAVKYMVC